VTFGTPVKDVSYVFSAFKKVVDDKAAAAATTKPTVKTGATAMTTYAASLVAAIYALAF